MPIITVKCVDSFGHVRVIERLPYRTDARLALAQCVIFIAFILIISINTMPLVASFFLLGIWCSIFFSTQPHLNRVTQAELLSTRQLSEKRLSGYNSALSLWFVQCYCEIPQIRRGRRVASSNKLTLWAHQFKDADYRRLLALLNIYHKPNQALDDLTGIFISLENS